MYGTHIYYVALLLLPAAPGRAAPTYSSTLHTGDELSRPLLNVTVRISPYTTYIYSTPIEVCMHCRAGWRMARLFSLVFTAVSFCSLFSLFLRTPSQYCRTKCLELHIGMPSASTTPRVTTGACQPSFEKPLLNCKYSIRVYRYVVHTKVGPDEYSPKVPYSPTVTQISLDCTPSRTNIHADFPDR